MSGTGTIYANGETPARTQGPNGRDGSSGGGGGGTVLIYHLVGSTSGISIEAAAGQGGSQNLTSTSEAEGAGGGGGGGYVAITNLPPITISVAGGVNGTSNSSSVSAFTPNGATSVHNRGVKNCFIMCVFVTLVKSAVISFSQIRQISIVFSIN